MRASARKNGRRVDSYTVNNSSSGMDSDKDGDVSCLHCVEAMSGSAGPDSNQEEDPGSGINKGKKECQFQSPFLALKSLLRMFQAIGVFNFSVYNDFADFVCR